MHQYLPTDKEHIHIYGRTKLQNPLPLFWTASGIEFNTYAGEVWVTMEARYQNKEIWIQVEVDDIMIQRILLPREKAEYCLFRELPEDQCKKVSILQCAQPFQEDKERVLLIHEVKASKPLEILQKKPLTIEVIGDSLSSGEGLTGSNKLCGWSAGLFGINGHYGRRIATHFDADMRIISQCGWGVHVAYDNNPFHVLPPFYHQICGILSGEEQIRFGALEEYDFASWKADIVLINLGTNDGNATLSGPWTDESSGKKYQFETNELGALTPKAYEAFETTVITFLKDVRKCNPDSYIIWGYGMCDYRMHDYLRRAFERYMTESKDEAAEFVLLPKMVYEQRGANYHPGSMDHKAAADVLIDRIKAYLQRK